MRKMQDLPRHGDCCFSPCPRFRSPSIGWWWTARWPHSPRRFVLRPLASQPVQKLEIFVVLACAALTRETGFLLVLAYCAYLAWRREFRMAGHLPVECGARHCLVWLCSGEHQGATYRPSFDSFQAILAVPWGILRNTRLGTRSPARWSARITWRSRVCCWPSDWRSSGSPAFL